MLFLSNTHQQQYAKYTMLLVAIFCSLCILQNAVTNKIITAENSLTSLEAVSSSCDKNERLLSYSSLVMETEFILVMLLLGLGFFVSQHLQVDHTTLFSALKRRPLFLMYCVFKE